MQYTCRKTLADSRPRVKGRFARNGGDYTETEADAVADHHVHVPAAAHQSESESESESPAATAATPEWWPGVQEELPAGINLAELCADDDEMLAAYLGVSSISIADRHYSCHP
jgi:ribonuclease P/MRP protein subunit RPP1